jgi:hypothetical protein
MCRLPRESASVVANPVQGKRTDLTHVVTLKMGGFGGLVVSMLASGTQDLAGSNPADAVGFFRAKKSTACLPSVPCRRFAACKRTLRFTWKSQSQAKLIGHFSP